MMQEIIKMTDQGLVYLTENEIFDLVVQKYQEVSPAFNLDPSEPDGYMAAWMAQQLRVAVEAIVQCYNSKDPNTARDQQLNIIGALTGSAREDGTPTVIDIEVGATNGTVVTAGSVIEGNNYEWTIDSDIAVDVTGTATGTATCTVDGAITPENGTVTNIKTTIGGWSNVTNTGISINGTDKQSNAQFRVERNKSVGRPGNNQVDSAIGELFAVDDVLRVAAYENPTGSAAVDPELNPHGLPAHSMSYVVLGGTDEDVAQAIYNKKNPGNFLNQAGVPVSVEVASKKHPSNSKVIKFGRPSLVDINIVLEVADPNGNTPGNLEQLVQGAIIEYVSGDLIDADDGFDSTGFDIGEDVPVRRIDTPINQVIGQYKGAYINSLTVNGQSNGAITIEFDEYANFLAENIAVTVV